MVGEPELRLRRDLRGSRRAARYARRAARRRAQFAWAAAIVIVVGAGVGVTALVNTSSSAAEASVIGLDAATALGTAHTARAVTDLPVPVQTAVPAPAVCDDPVVLAALDDGTDADDVTAFGGGGAFRSAIADGVADCVDLSAADRVWVVVNKRHAVVPRDFAPADQAQAAGVQRTSGGHMRSDVAAALAKLADAVVADGAGAIGVNSGFRPLGYQEATYAGYLGVLGRADADLTSARAGYSEHQTGLAVDIVACDSGCGGIDAFGGTDQADWVAENAWRFGFIVRYEAGYTDVTGYEAEPWHLRYLSPELAAVYHEGGYHTLEEFFGLPPAPDYTG
ncbi:M15 family metallopeptidase [Microbacterium sp.]|uniref:M15 family metallopeptidase n=1 Tax=Microbacterium sp. TaxID=51671 RepID=UPI003A877964